MRVVVGHANPDFDAYAATIAATKLFPGAKGVFLGSQNANVRAFHHLHEEFLDFVDLKGLDLDVIDSVVMVDTRDPSRIGEIGEVVGRPGVEVIIYDHHPPQEGDFTGGDDRSRDAGSATAILVHEIRAQALDLAPLEASAMLLGIHEDTGSLTYPGSTPFDAEAVAYLMSIGADIGVLNQFLGRTLDDSQRALLDQLLADLEVWEVCGQQVAVGTAETQEYVDSASVLTHYVVEDLGYRVAIAIVKMPERLQIVARSRLAEVDVGAVMERLGGGGHPQAASAGFRALSLAEARARVREALAAEVHPPLRAVDIMSRPVRTLPPTATMQAAGELMALWGHGGVPIVADGEVLGIITRKDVDRASRHGLGHAPVTGFMGREVLSVPPDMRLPDLERVLATRSIGRVPVLDGGELVGIVSRKDVLRAGHGDAYLDRGLAESHPEATRRFLASVDALLPGEVAGTIRRLGEIAAESGLRAHLVGGFVRDMVLGRPNLDIDIVVEGDAIAFAEDCAAELGARVKVHRRFGTAVMIISRDLHVDVASSRAEFYSRPGALPTVERSTLRQDLLRRDFTINAMAACIDPVCFGRIADPFGGLTDIDRGLIRVLHSLSFVDDPTRVLRAARFEKRYGFTMSASTEELASEAVRLGMLGEVSGARVREELLDILDEPDPAAVFARLEELGALGDIAPRSPAASGLVGRIESALAAFDEIGTAFEPKASRRETLVTAILAGAERAEVDRWLRHYRFGRSYARPALDIALKGASALRVLQDKRGVRDTRLYRALSALAPESVVLLWTRTNALGRERIGRYIDVLARIKPSVNGKDLIEMGYEPSDAFTAILARALDDRIDGRAVGREAELANLRRIAQRALGDPPKKAAT